MDMMRVMDVSTKLYNLTETSSAGADPEPPRDWKAAWGNIEVGSSADSNYI